MGSQRKAVFSLFALFLLLIVSALSWAQSTTSLRGTVTDRSGAAVGGATVTLSSPERSFERTVTSSPEGAYEFLQLTPGAYQLTVESGGFKQYQQREIHLLVNTPATLNVSLEVGARAEVVEVTAEAAVVNTQDASLGNAVNEHQVKELPLEGRSVPDLLSLQAGVAYTGNRDDVDRNTDTRSGAVNGARSDQSNVTLDGVDVNDQVNGDAFTSVLPVTLDSVQEFRVTTTNHNADEGRSSGAQVSLITKGGTNNFHGSLYEYHRNTATSANDYFIKQAELGSGAPNEPPKLIRNIFGGSLGGPILKDRLFFFVNYEEARQREESSVVRVVPSDALRDGIITYKCATPAACPAATVQGDNGPHDIEAGFKGLNRAQITGMDPLSIGPNSVVMNYFNSFPVANDVTSGVGDGVNFVGYRFRGPVPTNKHWYIARMDYKLTSDGSHSLFWRGALRNDYISSAPYFLGESPLHTQADFSKGFTVGYSAVLRPTLINNFRWGFTRQSFGDIGNNDSQPFIFFRGLNDNSTTNNSSLAVTRSQNYQTPVHNFVDDVSWTKGKHTLQFGTNVMFIRSPRSNFLNAFSQGVTNASALDTAGLAVKTGSPLNPSNHGFPAVFSGFANSYDFPLMAMMGIVSELDATYNFDRNGNPQPLNTPVKRRWGTDSFEFYAQDSFRVKPNLTLNFGLRYSLETPPWETNGTQVAPSVSMGQWFADRGKRMLEGRGSDEDPTVSFDLAGAANGKPGYYKMDKNNFGPHVSFAYSPRMEKGFLHKLFGDNDKTVVRGGFGVVFDHIGPGLLNSFDANGSFGLSTQLSNDVVPSVASAPRLTGLNTIPDVSQGFPPAPQGGFPFTPPDGGTGLAIFWGLDDTIKSPYSYTVDFSIGRELPHNIGFEVSYVGRYSHRLLVQEDLAMPLDIVDPTSKIDYFKAARKLTELNVAGTPAADINASTVGPTAAYWQNLLKPLASGDAYSVMCDPNAPDPNNPLLSTTDPVTAAYGVFSCFPYNETTALGVLDFYGSDFNGVAGIQSANDPSVFYPTIIGQGAQKGQNVYFNRQFHSLYAWRSVGNANYNALQVNIRKRASHGLQFDFNYTYSKSIDLSSDAERIIPWGGLGGQVINSWDPNALRAVSDFDMTHQFNMNWIYELPFGKGKPFGTSAGGALDAVIGGWQLSGLARWSSGLPDSITSGFTWSTNWQLSGGAVPIGKFKAKTTKHPDGTVTLFPDPQGSTGIGAFRPALPGESGTRNILRGDGFAGLDMSLSKRWKMPYAEGHSVQFRWEVFNVPNLTRFDVRTVSGGLDAGDSFGTYGGLLTKPRVMEFALRYEF